MQGRIGKVLVVLLTIGLLAGVWTVARRSAGREARGAQGQASHPARLSPSERAIRDFERERR